MYHPSFLDFVEDRIIEGEMNWMGIEELNQLVFKGCLLTLERELKFNICNLRDSSLFNRDVPGIREIITTHISEALQYSSLFWFAHLSESGLGADNDDAKRPVYVLLVSTKVLFWLEVLCLLGSVGRGITILQECAVFFAVRYCRTSFSWYTNCYTRKRWLFRRVQPI